MLLRWLLRPGDRIEVILRMGFPVSNMILGIYIEAFVILGVKIKHFIFLNY